MDDSEDSGKSKNQANTDKNKKGKGRKPSAASKENKRKCTIIGLFDCHKNQEIAQVLSPSISKDMVLQDWQCPYVS